MSPRIIALSIVLLPLLASNGAFLLSAYQGYVAWCMPYIDGCTTISQAGRSGNTIFYYRALVFPYGVFLLLFWVYAKEWLGYLYGNATTAARVICWLGVVGSVALLVYIDFLGTTGEVNRFMRRIGAMLYFTLIPLAQSLLLYQHYKVRRMRPETSINPTVLQYQLVITLLMLTIAVVSVLLVATGNNSYEVENIVEWNFSLLINLYSAGMIMLWRDYRQVFTISADEK